MELETAINWLKSNYELGLKNQYIKEEQKIAYALYLTWQEVEQAISSQEYIEKHKYDADKEQ